MMKRATLIMLGGWILLAAGTSEAGDAVAGKAKSESCVQCHGETGKDDPPIAGMPETDFIKAMHEYRSGERKDRKMAKALRDLSDTDISDLAAYYATLQ